jgi:hypothetical protein
MTTRIPRQKSFCSVGMRRHPLSGCRPTTAPYGLTRNARDRNASAHRCGAGSDNRKRTRHTRRVTALPRPGCRVITQLVQPYDCALRPFMTLSSQGKESPGKAGGSGGGFASLAFGAPRRALCAGYGLTVFLEHQAPNSSANHSLVDQMTKNLHLLWNLSMKSIFSFRQHQSLHLFLVAN